MLEVLTGEPVMQGQWADGDHLPGTLQGQYTPDQLQLLCLSQVPKRPYVLAAMAMPSQHDCHITYVRMHCLRKSRASSSSAAQDSDELWTLSPPARRSLETLLRNSSDASVRTSVNIIDRRS